MSFFAADFTTAAVAALFGKVNEFLFDNIYFSYLFCMLFLNRITVLLGLDAFTVLTLLYFG